MPLYFIKPIVWSSNGYRRPCGGKFTDGYPEEHGFGHEEWNNAADSGYVEQGKRFRLFYTGDLGTQPVAAHAGDMVIFMIASHAGRQYLVGVAGGVESLDAADKVTRARIAKACPHFAERWRDAWALPSVRDLHGGDQPAFRAHWRGSGGNGMPPWRCPNELFLWLDSPLELDPPSISGKQRLISMYGSYQEIDRPAAMRILASVEENAGGAVLANLKFRFGSAEADLQTDLRILDQEVETATTKDALVQARLGQGAFRRDLLSMWEGGCALTGCTIAEILRASHIRPWRESTNRQRLDPNNGLLLEATLDALFDRGLISFSDEGTILVRDSISAADRQRLGLDGRLRKPLNADQKRYLRMHREYFGLA